MTLAQEITTISGADTMILYDGDCVYCSHYAALIKLRQNVGPVALLNLREQAGIVTLLRGHGIEPNRGMVFVYQDRVHYGEDALQILAIHSETSGILGLANRSLFRYRWVSRVLYPVLKLGRRLTLIVRGKTLIP